MTTMMRVCAAITVAGVALTACGGSDTATKASGGSSTTPNVPDVPTAPAMHADGGSVAPSIPVTARPSDLAGVADRTACSFLGNKITAGLYDSTDRGKTREYPIVLSTESAISCSLTGLPTVLLLDAQGRTVGTPKPGQELKAAVLKTTAPAQFKLVTARDGGTARTAKIKITLPHGGGSQIIDSHGLTVDAKKLGVTGFSSRGAGG